MTDFKEEGYFLEDIEISEDNDDGFEYKEIKDDDDQDIIDDVLALPEDDDEEDDLEDFNKLKAKTEAKKIA